jgi:hypothetical protein
MQMSYCWGWVLLHCLTFDGFTQWVLQESGVILLLPVTLAAEWWIFETKMKDDGFEKAIFVKKARPSFLNQRTTTLLQTSEASNRMHHNSRSDYNIVSTAKPPP